MKKLKEELLLIGNNGFIDVFTLITVAKPYNLSSEEKKEIKVFLKDNDIIIKKDKYKFESQKLQMSTNPIDIYYNDIKDNIILTKEEEQECFKILSEDNTRLDIYYKIYLANLKLVISIACKYYETTSFSHLDIVQEGNLGLSNAIKKFDYKKGYKFSTYATFWINQAIKVGIIENRNTIKITKYMEDIFTKIKKFEIDYMKKYMKSPTYDNIKDELGYNYETIDLYRIFSKRITSLDIITLDEEGEVLSNRIEDRSVNLQNKLEQDELSKYIYEFLKEQSKLLTPKEKDVISHRFGFSGYDDISLNKIGEMLGGISRERVRQIEKKAIGKIRKKYNTEYKDK